MQAVLEVYALHDLDIRPHVLLALVLYKVVDQVRASCKLLVHMADAQTVRGGRPLPNQKA